MNDWHLNENGFEVYTPQQYRPWYNFISNDEYGIKISHLGDAYATTLAQPRIAVSNYDFFYPSKGRFVFIKDNDCIWNPSFLPTKTSLDSYSCKHEPGVTTFCSKKNNIQVCQTIFVPRKGTAEIWMISIENTGETEKNIDIIPQMEFLLYNSFGVDPIYYSWFSDTKIDNKNALLFIRRIGSPAIGFFAPLEKPDSFETSLKRFIGNSDISYPESIKNGQLSNSISGGDPYIGAFHYKFTLKKGKKKTLCFFAGAGEDVLDSLRTQFTSINTIQNELDIIRLAWKKKLSLASFETIENGIYKNWLKTFFGYQIYQQSLGMVRGTFRGFRDVAQDVMGIVHYDKDKARSLLVDLGKRMYSSGQCLRQWNTEGGPNDERDFRDLPFWLIIALEVYERYTGDNSIYMEKVGWVDSCDAHGNAIEAVSLWEHALIGIKYALIYSQYGLIKMGVGDWNDALSGPGKEGGSTFLNQIAYYALSIIEKVSSAHNFKHSFNIQEEKEKLFQGLMKYWNGSWFARAVTESGDIIGDENDNTGTDTHYTGGRVFLLPQVWFIISGMYAHSEESKHIAEQALNTVIEKLETPVGLLKCFPGYNVYDVKVGNLSALTPGIAENFAIYNHAAAFAVYAFNKIGRQKDAQRILEKILPFNRDWKQSKSEPYVLVNFYNGGFYKEKLGEGGISWLTGTINWLALSFFDFKQK